MIQNNYTALVKGEVCPFRSDEYFFVVKEKHGYSKWNRLYYISEDEVNKRHGFYLDDLRQAN